MKNRKNLRYLTQLSVLLALELILAYTPLGYLRVLPGLEISFLMIPVALGAMLLGPAAGAVLGGAFGLTSFGTCFGASTFGATLLAVDPLLTFLTCVPTRLLAGWLTGLLFRVLSRRSSRALKTDGQQVPVPAYACGAGRAGAEHPAVYRGAGALFLSYRFYSGLCNCPWRRKPFDLYGIVRGHSGVGGGRCGLCRVGPFGPRGICGPAPQPGINARRQGQIPGISFTYIRLLPGVLARFLKKGLPPARECGKITVAPKGCRYHVRP